MQNQISRFIFRAGLGAVLAASCLYTSGQAQPPGKNGKKLFEKRCGGCHALDRDKEGPRLGGVYGRSAASIASFPYSAGLQDSKIIWTDATLDKWLTNPAGLVPDNDMTFYVESFDERCEIISYLKELSSRK